MPLDLLQCLAVYNHTRFLPFHITSKGFIFDLAAMTGLVGYGSSDEEDCADEGRSSQLMSEVRYLKLTIHDTSFLLTV